jgi:hypothetical protein
MKLRVSAFAGAANTIAAKDRQPAIVPCTHIALLSITVENIPFFHITTIRKHGRRLEKI